VFDISRDAPKIVRRVLALPDKQLLPAKFTETHDIRRVLVDSVRIEELIDLCIRISQSFAAISEKPNPSLN
jgi:hypothetical protein